MNLLFKFALAWLTLLAAASLARAGEVTVSAAASLGNAFTDIANHYQARYPGERVRLNVGGSGALLQQVANGAPVDVFAPADQDTMDRASAKRLVKASDRKTFATNLLVVAVPANAKAPIRSLKDLAGIPGRRIAMGNPDSVPAGRYAQVALTSAGLWRPVSAGAVRTQTVRQALDYVARGEVDAAFVYATDAALMKGKVKVAFVVPMRKAVSYPIAPVSASANTAGARRFIAYVQSPAGQAILAAHGFLKP